MINLTPLLNTPFFLTIEVLNMNGGWEWTVPHELLATGWWNKTITTQLQMVKHGICRHLTLQNGGLT